jgi:hypothetical protein
MTKAELIKALEQYPDDSPINIVAADMGVGGNVSVSVDYIGQCPASLNVIEIGSSELMC